MRAWFRPTRSSGSRSNCARRAATKSAWPIRSGYANPAQVRDLVVRVRAVTGKEKFAGLHLHNTRGLGLANVVAGLEVDVDTFDSSMAGIGGCPFAPGATGNIVTEDLVFMLEAMGLNTGIDLGKLLAAREDPRRGGARRRTVWLRAGGRTAAGRYCGRTRSERMNAPVLPGASDHARCAATATRRDRGARPAISS